ncbi:hypothetical protein [Leifsonia sp. LS-T14]|uniref:hypothetical protein n=1 Tax=unclassified Leifsonia TaxID=2663824 RepID=UPI0035A6A7AE
MLRTGAAALVALASAIALTGCAAGSGTAGSPAPTVTVTSTVTATPTPTPAVVSPDDLVDAQTAWTACAVLAQEVYGSQAPNAKLLPYTPSQAPTKNADGQWVAIVGFPLDPPVEGTGSVIVSCTIGGTMGSPKLIHWVAKDI